MYYSAFNSRDLGVSFIANLPTSSTLSSCTLTSMMMTRLVGTVVAVFAAACKFTAAFAPPTSPALMSSRVSAFHASNKYDVSNPRTIKASQLFSKLATKLDVDRRQQEVEYFDPFKCGDEWGEVSANQQIASEKPINTALILAPLSIIIPSAANAANDGLSTGLYNPDSFKPVCSASDSFYRLLQGSTRTVVGDENFSEYGPLIAGGLLRIRLELCVVESFFNEAVGPFIKENGLSWILPFHETVETFLAGTIFALATTFILVGSTKLIQIIAFYGDLIVGGPCRLFGGFFFDRARGEPVTLDVSFFGFFKTRLVGPPIDFKEEESKKKISGDGQKSLLDLDKVKPTDIPLLAVSGGVKLVGEASKVSSFAMIGVIDRRNMRDDS